MRRVQYDSVFAFKYSDRPGVPAVELAGKLNDVEKGARLTELLDAKNDNPLQAPGPAWNPSAGAGRRPGEKTEYRRDAVDRTDAVQQGGEFFRLRFLQLYRDDAAITNR